MTFLLHSLHSVLSTATICSRQSIACKMRREPAVSIAKATADPWALWVKTAWSTVCRLLRTGARTSPSCRYCHQLHYLLWYLTVTLPGALQCDCNTSCMTVWLRYLLYYLTVTSPVVPTAMWLQYLVYVRMITLPAVISHSNITCNIAVWLQYLVYDQMITLPAVISHSNITCSIAVWLQYLLYDHMITLPAVLPHNSITCSIAVWWQHLVWPYDYVTCCAASQ